jgi:ABC-type polysaccharide/polyol phosphate transport system ATPase subunit
MASAGATPFSERDRMTVLRLRARGLGVVRCRSRSRAAIYALRDAVGDMVPGEVQAPRLRPGEFLALEGIDLELRAGEAVAVIGDNGAGKSTLLKALGGLLAPRRGEIERNGHVETVSELGASLNPFLSGRENVQLVALLRELPDREGADYLDRVCDFADLGAGIDEPTGSYSTGMIARLAFSMAAMARPDVLLVDEALSVGDPGFQRKCARFIASFLAERGAVVLASHNMLQVQSLCERAILIADGRAIFSGSAVEAVRLMVRRALPEPARQNDGDGAITLVRFAAADGALRTGSAAQLEAEYSLVQDFGDVIWGFGIWTADAEHCVTTAQDLSPRSLVAGKGRLRCAIDRLMIAPGNYTLRLHITDRTSGTPVALSGWGHAIMPLTVDSPPSIESNHQLDFRQMVVLDVSWP